MSASKYLPPFTAAERGTVGGDRPARDPEEPVRPVAGTEATYADFLGDEVDE
ncbi:hypothetical protein [Curtobacterium pusillum]|uniref:hypothetical protein n=1 Tax=Curtobacterium pusillum TaxID=69373 RepID=UPI001643CA79|nr:hypothetical protein [Curtobacterium pusillum]